MFYFYFNHGVTLSFDTEFHEVFTLSYSVMNFVQLRGYIYIIFLNNYKKYNKALG